MPSPDSQRPQSLPEIPTKENLAQHAKTWLEYSAEEGTLQDVKEWLSGLDVESVLAYIEVEELDKIRGKIATALMEDERVEVQKALNQNPAIFKNPLYDTVHYAKAPRMTPGNEIAKARREVANTLGRVREIGRVLRSDEIKNMCNMARNIPDDQVIKEVMHFAIQYPEIAYNLLSNPEIRPQDTEKIAETAFRYIMSFGENLTPEHISAIGKMLRNKHDAQFIEAIFPLAKKNSDIALDIVFNPGVNSAQINEIARVAVSQPVDDKKWAYVLFEIAARNYPMLDEEMRVALTKDPRTKEYIDFVRTDEKASESAQKSDEPKPGKTSEQRRKERRDEKVGKLSHFSLLEQVQSDELDEEIKNASGSPQETLKIMQESVLNLSQVSQMVDSVMAKLEEYPDEEKWFTVMAQLINRYYDQIGEEIRVKLEASPKVREYVGAYLESKNKQPKKSKKWEPQSLSGETGLFLRK